MNTSNIRFRAGPILSAALLAWVGGCANAPTAPTAPAAMGSRLDPSVAENLPKGPEVTLKVGMTAAEVKAIMGQPADIKPIETPIGTAERWVYRRSTRGAARQVQVGTNSTQVSSINSSTGSTNVMQTIDEPIYKMQTQVFDETINLLVYDGKFMKMNRVVEVRMEFD